MLPRLYNSEISGNCYKVRLLFSFLGLDYEKVPIGKVPGSPTSANDVPAGFLKLNPRGQIPVLEMDGQVLWDSTAILIYIARRHGGEQWFPLCANGMARVAQWLALAQNDILFGVARARSIRQGRQIASLEDAERFAQRAMATLQAGLEDQQWLAAEHPTIADIACYPYAALAADAGIALEDYPALPAWFRRIQALPGYLDMPGITRS
ncbi:MAG: glutathione S-transferase [Gammaproteobacteria bacterium]|jgi:glutathione S-transferase